MIMTPAVEAEALIVIGTIESNMTWNFVDYADPIKIGIAQWSAGSAAGLLGALDAADKAELESTLTADMAQYPVSSDFWTSRYLTKDEGNGVIRALSSNTAKSTMRSFFGSMLGGYETILSTWGCDADGTTQQKKAFIFLSAVYHVSVPVCGQIVAAIGGGAHINDIYAAIMNKPSIAQSRDWETARLLLEAWEGDTPTVTGDDIQPNTDPGGSGQENAPIVQVESQIQRIGLTGQQLVVYGKDNPNGVLCYRETNTMWIPYVNTAAPPTPTPTEPEPEPEPMPPSTQTEWEQMRQLWYDNEEAWYYSQGPGRLDPPSSGYSDCSASIIWAVSQIRPDLGEQLGVWTGSMVNAGTEVARGATGSGAHVDLDILKPGDILLVGNNYEFDNGKSHVEWYFGDGQLWGSGYSPLPHRSGDINDYLVMIASRGKTLYMIRRFL